MGLKELIDLTVEDFLSLEGKEFVIDFNEENQTSALLSEVKQLPNHFKEGRTPFILTFNTNQKNLYFEQGVFPVSREGFGRYDIFLCPKGPDEVGMKYEAVFG